VDFSGMAFPPFSGYYKFRGRFYLWPFCWVSLAEKKNGWHVGWSAGGETQQKISGWSIQPTNKPWLMLEPSPNFQTCFGH
jgi:hypothetical protein